MKVKLVVMALAAFISGVLITFWGAIPVGIRQGNIFFSGSYSCNRCVQRPGDSWCSRARLLWQRSGGTGGDQGRVPMAHGGISCRIQGGIQRVLGRRGDSVSSHNRCPGKDRGGYKLEAGKTYRLATRFNAREGWHKVTSVNQHIEVTSIEHAQELRERFTSAIEQEIPFNSEYR